MARQKYCPDCAERVQRAAKVCRYCGFRFDLNPDPANKKGGIRWSVIAMIAAGVLAISYFGKDTEQRTATAAAPKVETKAIETSGSSDKPSSREKGSSILYQLTQGDADADESAAEKASAEAECRQDLQCWGDRKLFSASIDCSREVERLAKFDFEWTDGWLEAKLSRFQWNDRDKGIIAYWGDKVKFQNGLGAWQVHTYKCIYDTLNSKVVEATASPGRI